MTPRHNCNPNPCLSLLLVSVHSIELFFNTALSLKSLPKFQKHNNKYHRCTVIKHKLKVAVADYSVLVQSKWFCIKYFNRSYQILCMNNILKFDFLCSIASKKLGHRKTNQRKTLYCIWCRLRNATSCSRGCVCSPPGKH